jgi:adenylylsulfate kinase
MIQNIHPINDQLIPRTEREKLLGQKARVFWLTGLSGSGKSTLAIRVQEALHREGKLAYVLDGDTIRAGINSNLGFSDADRTENVRRIAEIATLFVDAGCIIICCFVSPTNAIRHLAAQIIGPSDFHEIYINASLETCELRDVKGLYAKARKGEITDFTGIHQNFEIPENPAMNIDTSHTIEESTAALLKYIQTQVRLNHA